MFFAVGLNIVYVEGVVIYVARGLVNGSLGECDPNFNPLLPGYFDPFPPG